MSDVEVAVTSDEIEAEIIGSRLEAYGIPARIAPRSQIGMPASWSPRGLGYGIGSFGVRVPEEHVRVARDVLADALPRRGRPPRTRLALRVIATVLLLWLVIPMAISLATWWRQLF